jgi:hypothetical protein
LQFYFRDLSITARQFRWYRRQLRPSIGWAKESSFKLGHLGLDRGRFQDHLLVHQDRQQPRGKLWVEPTAA